MAHPNTPDGPHSSEHSSDNELGFDPILQTLLILRSTPSDLPGRPGT